MKFALVVGHEADQPGARATVPLDCYEYEYNSGLAAQIVACLMDEGIESEIFFRDEVGIHGAYAEVNAYSPSGVVELHFNAAGLGDVRGSETLYAKDSSLALARMVHGSICLAFDRSGPLDRGVKRIAEADRGYVNLTTALCPSILIEPFFGDNPDDSQLGMQRKAQLASAVAQGISSFLKAQTGVH